MQTLRHARFLARLVLAWFVLSLSVAMASPIVQPQSTELVCSAGGVMKLIVKGDEAGKEVKRHVLDCPLCASLAAPPPTTRPQVEPPPARAYFGPSKGIVATVPRAAAPLPARGPPAIL